MEDLYNEIKDYTNEQLLSAISLVVMHRLYCKDMLVEAQQEYDKYKEVPEFIPQSVKYDFDRWKCALQHALEIEHVYKELLIERGVIKMGSECNN